MAPLIPSFTHSTLTHNAAMNHSLRQPFVSYQHCRYHTIERAHTVTQATRLAPLLYHCVRV